MNNTSGVVLIAIFLLGMVVLGMWGCPRYNVYSQQKEGEAQLAHAQSSREVAVAEAKAKMESATLLAQADTIRAHGIARSNQIIGNSLTKNYLSWFWISQLDQAGNIIYVPTEANMPVLEATRFNNRNGLKAMPDTTE
jgi:predicted aminopeptidase